LLVLDAPPFAEAPPDAVVAPPLADVDPPLLDVPPVVAVDPPLADVDPPLADVPPVADEPPVPSSLLLLEQATNESGLSRTLASKRRLIVPVMMRLLL
jgi:hypothetical protein